MLDTLKIARDLSEGDVFTHEQAERLANALATYWIEIRSELVTKEYLDARLNQLEASSKRSSKPNSHRCRTGSWPLRSPCSSCSASQSC